MSSLCLMLLAAADPIAFRTSGFGQALADATRPVLVYLWMGG